MALEGPRRAAILQPGCGKAAQPQPCTCQGTPTLAHRGQELPWLSVDSEMEFATLNRARVHRQHNGTASPRVPVKLLLPCFIPSPSPAALHRGLFSGSSMSTAACCFTGSLAGLSSDTSSYLGEHSCHVLSRAPRVLQELAAPSLAELGPGKLRVTPIPSLFPSPFHSPSLLQLTHPAPHWHSSHSDSQRATKPQHEQGWIQGTQHRNSEQEEPH